MLGKTLRRLIKHGRLTVVRPDGDEEQFGELAAAEPRQDVAVRLKGVLTSLKLALHPDLYLGELYMDGALVLERGTLWDLLEPLGRNQLEQGRVPGNSAIRPLRAVLTRIQQSNSRPTCSIPAPISPTQAFLWNKRKRPRSDTSQPSFYWSRASGCSTSAVGGAVWRFPWPERVEVVGVTLSREQLTVARQRAKQAQLDERVRFTLNDYREIEGPFDRIVSVGMFEHVGVPNYARFFQKIRELLSPDSIALIHSIGRSNGPTITSAWTRKYIFPGGHIPALRRSPQSSSVRVWFSPIWRSCACTMPRRFVTGVSAFWRATDMMAGSTMSGFAACGILPCLERIGVPLRRSDGFSSAARAAVRQRALDAGLRVRA